MNDSVTHSLSDLPPALTGSLVEKYVGKYAFSPQPFLFVYSQMHLKH